MALTQVSVRQGLKWARSARSPWQKIRDYLGRLWHVRFALPFPSAGSFFRAIARITVWLGLATAPFWIDYFDKAEVPRNHLYLYSAIMFALLVGNWALDTFVKNAARRNRLEDHREESALEHRNLVNEMLNIVNVPTANFGDAAFMSVLGRALRAILQRVREEFDTLDAGYLEASLLVFQPNDQITVLQRAVRNRAVGATTDRQKTMAHFVALAGLDWRQVPDLKREHPFSSEGISDPNCPYRSILLIPIIYADPARNEAVGVVTIDSARPYEFWNEAATDRLYKQVMPFVRLIAILLQSHPEKIRCA